MFNDLIDTSVIGIYKFTNKYNGKAYIGKSVSIEGRFKSHFKQSELNKPCLFNYALKKYGKDGFDFEILLECPRESLDYWESFYIKYYNTNACNGGDGYNMTDGGDGVSIGNIPWNKGKHDIYSDEVKKSMGADKVGKPSPRRGVKLTNETKKLISVHSKGKKDSEETRKKKSIAKAGKNNPCYGKHRVYRPDGTYYYSL